MQRQRATMAFTARRLVSVIFPAIPTTLDTPQQRSSHPEAEHLLGKQGARKYSVLPPVLYPPGEEQSITKVFQNPALLLVSICFFLSKLPIYLLVYSLGGPSCLVLHLSGGLRQVEIRLQRSLVSILVSFRLISFNSQLTSSLGYPYPFPRLNLPRGRY